VQKVLAGCVDQQRKCSLLLRGPESAGRGTDGQGEPKVFQSRKRIIAPMVITGRKSRRTRKISLARDWSLSPFMRQGTSFSRHQLGVGCSSRGRASANEQRGERQAIIPSSFLGSPVEAVSMIYCPVTVSPQGDCGGHLVHESPSQRRTIPVARGPVRPMRDSCDLSSFVRAWAVRRL